MSLKKSVMLIDDTVQLCKEISVSNSPNFSSSLNSISEQYQVLITANYPKLTTSEEEFFITLCLFMKDKELRGVDTLVTYFFNLIKDVLISGSTVTDELKPLVKVVNTQFEKSNHDKSKTIEKIQNWNKSQLLSVLFVAKKEAYKLLK